MQSLVENSALYWEERYASGRNSGAGSYGRLAEFKANFINSYVAEAGIQTVLEFGCGDGAQLARAKYPNYIGVDVSSTVLNLAQRAFDGNDAIKFLHADAVECDFRADLTLSLDVIYHLVEDDVFEKHMQQLFHHSRRAVIIYSSNQDGVLAPHVRHRRFTNWISDNRVGFELTMFKSNMYPYDESDPNNTSFSDFYVYEESRSVARNEVRT
ncbi:class I SAM-dependent methyltransferase [Sphingomonas piscis]|uniref:Class I SAM-dependent methyltransferase n=1 Tax=Sphingomonas piscis TaxID=2714943 RepID=A0A6G7YSE8_9SPHN|nr:class I SAM-dependent methyltransferase [Sphingomonas piscis]QIK79662.1 class I SAM-dependent methyltransferase [Sphingomonas piscis]